MLSKFRDPKTAGAVVVVVLKKYIYFLIITYLSLSGCGFRGDPAEKTVVTIGTKEITAHDLTREIKRLASQMGISNQRAKEILQPLVNQIVDRYLILEYGRENGIIITEEDLNRAVKDLEADYQDQDLQEILLHGFLDYEEWTAELRQQLLVKKIVAKVSEGIKPASNQEITQYFEAHHDEFRRPYMVEFRQIVTASEEEAQELVKKLNGGGDMAQLAREYSIAPEAENGGEVGWVAKGDLEEGMEEAIFSLPVTPISWICRSSLISI